MNSLPRFSIKNSLLVNLLFVFILVIGYYSVSHMQREAFPNVSFDVVTITTAYPGATPSEIEKLITIPIEKEIKEVEDIKEITSTSTEGMSAITLKLEESVDNKDRVINDIQRAVDRVDDLPDDLQDKPVVQDKKTKNRPIIEVALSGNIEETKLREYAKALEKKFLEIPEVATIAFRGLRDYEFSVEVNPETLNEKHVSIKEIGQALLKQNKMIPGGKYYIDDHEYILRTTGELNSENDIKKTIVRASPLGNWIHVEDVAQVIQGFEEETVINRTQGSRSINLVVIKKEKGDAIYLVDHVKEISKSFQEAADPNLEITYINDMSYYIKRRQNVLINNGIIGMVMVIILLFMFLSVRTAIAAFIGIPTALFLTFTAMSLMGITFNLMAMFGLIMVLGMLVDEDIVISENIFRHLEQHKTPDEATITGVAEVAWPLIATVLTTVAAFTPLMIMGGIMGKFLRHIPMVVSITLFASLFQAMVILPSHIYHLNSGRLTPKVRSDRRHERFDWWRQHYRKILLRLTHRRYLWTILLVFFFIGTAVYAKNNMRFVLFPSKGVEILHIQAEGLSGDSLEIMSQKIASLEKIIDTLPDSELEHYTANVGIIQRDPNDPSLKMLTSVGQVIIYLTPENDRTRNSQDIINDLREQAKPLTGFSRLDFEKIKMGPPVGKPIQIRVRYEDYQVTQNIAAELQKTLENIDGVTDVQNDYDLDMDEYHVVVDPVKTAQTGLSVEDVALAVRHAFEGNIATKVKTTEEEIDVVVRFPRRLRHDNKALANLQIPNTKGQLIKMSEIVSFQKAKGLLAIKHHDRTRTINVTANVDEKKISALEVSQQMKDIITRAEAETPGLTVIFGGEIEETQESLTNMFHAFYLAALLILIILIAMLRSFSQPLIIMLTIPFAIIGIVFAFFIHKEAFSFMCLMGMIGMTGVIVDSGIIMIDFINKLHASGMAMSEAIIEGATTRLRAIVLTTLTTFFGIIPAAYGLGGSDPFIRPMALALNYGVVSGAVITIIFIPLFMMISDDIKKWFQRLW